MSAWTAQAAMSAPSMSWWGFPSISQRSFIVPGSFSSAFTTR